MAEAINIISLDVLPLPKTADEVAWKQYLFYMIAYCDTFHDFAKERPLEGEGRSVSKADIPNRFTFVQDLIKKMDSSIPFNTYLPIINSFKSGTFENNVYSAFTRLLNNPLINAIPDEAIRSSIKAYLPSVFSVSTNEELIQQDMNEKAFRTPGQIPPINAKVIELYMPAVVYGAETQDNLISFLKVAYPECIDTEIVKIVEDTASFPRNIFTTKMNNFKKIITTQTRWDPAGLSSFESANNEIANENVSAPSFRSTEPSTSPVDKFTYNSAYFNQAANTLIYPGGNYTITKAGPSVNHLFMHMAIEGDNVSGPLKDKFKQMIRAAKKDSKKNMTLPLDTNAGNDAGKDLRLRRLTSSKRSGDYENIHSAIQAKAIMFTGDEPAFTYGVLNKCPIVFHSCSASGHHFKLYIPPPTDPVAAAAAAEERKTVTAVLKAAELQKFFGGADIFYKSFLKNLKEVVFSSAEISIFTRSDVGRLLQVYLSKELELDREFFEDLVKARVIFRNLGDVQLANLSILDISSLQSDKYSRLLEEKLREIPDLETRNSLLEAKLSEIRKYIPLKFHHNLTSINAVNATLFKANTLGLPFLVNGANKYKLDPGGMFPHYKNLESNLGGIAKLLTINDKITNANLKRKNNNMIEGALEYLDINTIPDAETASKSTEIANNLIDKWLVSPIEGGHIKLAMPTMAGIKRSYNNKYYNVNVTRKRARNTVKNKYLTLHKAISNLDRSKIPFKLSPQDYADMVVYRLVMNDVILEIMPSKPVIYQEKNMDDAIELQDGGAPMSGDMKSYCIDLFMNHIEPFFRKHMEGTSGSASDMHVSVLRSIVGGTFIQDIELLLSEIIGSPEFPGDANSRIYTNMKTNAEITLNSIFTKLDNSYSNNNGKILKVNERHEFVSFDEIKGILNYYLVTPIIADRFFHDMDKIITYLNNLFIEVSVVPVSRDIAETAIDTLVDEPTYADKNILQDYIKYAVNDYLEVEILGVTVPSGGSIERAISRQRRKRNGSPRRKSLKNR
jgi:hypothetical protein